VSGAGKGGFILGCIKKEFFDPPLFVTSKQDVEGERVGEWGLVWFKKEFCPAHI